MSGQFTGQEARATAGSCHSKRTLMPRSAHFGMRVISPRMTVPNLACRPSALGRLSRRTRKPAPKRRLISLPNPAARSLTHADGHS